MRDLGARLLGAQEEERARLAGELHDDVNQHMTVLAFDLELLRRCIRERRPESEGRAAEASARARIVMETIRTLSHRLHPVHLRLIGLVPALDGLQRELSTARLPIAFSHDAVPAALRDDLTVCLFRIAQEALQNAIKHSGARQVSVRLAGVPDGLALTIDDDGAGFDVERVRRGLGLTSMEERAARAGGTLRILSRPGAGTRVEVTVPLEPLVTAEALTV
jgi:signal transduction histidine kinase